MNTQLKSRTRWINSVINRLEEVGLLIYKFVFLFLYDMWPSWISHERKRVLDIWKGQIFLGALVLQRGLKNLTRHSHISYLDFFSGCPVFLPAWFTFWCFSTLCFTSCVGFSFVLFQLTIYWKTIKKTKGFKHTQRFPTQTRESQPYIFIKCGVTSQRIIDIETQQPCTGLKLRSLYFNSNIESLKYVPTVWLAQKTTHYITCILTVPSTVFCFLTGGSTAAFSSLFIFFK